MLERQSLTFQVVDYVTSLIKSGQVKPGEKLPTGEQLSKILGVSRTCVREAMRVVESLGLVSVRPRVGPVVLQPLPTAVFNVDHLSTVACLQDTQLLLEFRMILEVGLASLAAEKATENDLAAMQKSMADYEQATGDTAVHEADVAFHKAIANATKNPIASMVLETISGPLYHQLQTLNKYPVQVKGALDDHREIYRAIERKNPIKARAAMRKHLETVERNIRISAAALRAQVISDAHTQEGVQKPKNEVDEHAKNHSLVSVIDK